MNSVFCLMLEDFVYKMILLIFKRLMRWIDIMIVFLIIFELDFLYFIWSIMLGLFLLWYWFLGFCYVFSVFIFVIDWKKLNICVLFFGIVIISSFCFIWWIIMFVFIFLYSVVYSMFFVLERSFILWGVCLVVVVIVCEFCGGVVGDK